MTFTEIVTEVMARTRQTSTEAQTRVGREVNDRNRRVTSSVGLGSSRRDVAAATIPTVIGVPQLVVPYPKLFALFLPATREVLNEITPDEWRHLTTVTPSSMRPRVYAITAVEPTQTEVSLYPTPDAVYQVGADVLIPAAALSGALSPPFSEDFHDVLMHGALADEWFQLKQDDLSKRSEAMYEQRLSELRYFIVKSGYLDIHQGKRAERAWPWSWYPYSRVWW